MTGAGNRLKAPGKSKPGGVPGFPPPALSYYLFPTTYYLPKKAPDPRLQASGGGKPAGIPGSQSPGSHLPPCPTPYSLLPTTFFFPSPSLPHPRIKNAVHPASNRNNQAHKTNGSSQVILVHASLARLWLLPSRPDQVHGATLQRAQLSTPPAKRGNRLQRPSEGVQSRYSGLRVRPKASGHR